MNYISISKSFDTGLATRALNTLDTKLCEMQHSIVSDTRNRIKELETKRSESIESLQAEINKIKKQLESEKMLLENETDIKEYAFISKRIKDLESDITSYEEMYQKVLKGLKINLTEESECIEQLDELTAYMNKVSGESIICAKMMIEYILNAIKYACAESDDCILAKQEWISRVYKTKAEEWNSTDFYKLTTNSTRTINHIENKLSELLAYIERIFEN